MHTQSIPPFMSYLLSRFFGDLQGHLSKVSPTRLSEGFGWLACQPGLDIRPGGTATCSYPYFIFSKLKTLM